MSARSFKTADELRNMIVEQAAKGLRQPPFLSRDGGLVRSSAGLAAGTALATVSAAF